MVWKNRDSAWIYGMSGALLLITALLYRGYFSPEWKKYQTGFKELVSKRLGPDRAEKVPAGLQQIWVRDLGRVDRCTTCHLGVEWQDFDNVPAPYKSHPKGVLEKHPVAKYGCTICHGGQGYATDARSAHATLVEHWEEPLLGEELSRSYGFEDPKALIQVNCNLCHRNDRETKGADFINYGKQLTDEYGCDSCHKINGRGGTVGPDLTNAGDNSPEHYDFSRVTGAKSSFGWHLAHLKDPEAVAGETEMPNFGLDSKQVKALAMLLMSWKRANLPVTYIPAACPPPTESAGKQAKAE